MKSLLLVTADGALHARLLRTFAGASIFVTRTDAEAIRTLPLVDVEAVIYDARGAHRDLDGFVARAKELRPGSIVIAIGPSGDAAEAVDFVLTDDWTQRDLDVVLRQVADRQRLLREIAVLRSQAAPHSPSGGGAGEEVRETTALAPVLKEFTRVFAAGFDLRRVLEMLLDALGQLLRPSRSALLLPDEGGQSFRVASHRGLAPQIVGSARLSANDGLGRWLAVQGRPARLLDLLEPELIRELGLFGGAVAVPLLAHGEMVAVLVVGQPVVGGGYTRHETEILFDLATHLATAIRDITLHNQLQAEKEFNERILAHMASGVVTLGRDQKIGIVNRRAEEILGLVAAETIGRDLRALPSPLGDLLFETLVHGEARPPSEIQLAHRGLWLEISTYPIRGDDPAPLGAVLVFEDRTAEKELAARKRQAEQFELLARVVARIADEIKNPLVSINTFVDLIDERYEDPDFRKLFSSVVRRDVRRLVQVFEKLAGLVSEGELNFSSVDAHAVIEDVVTGVEMSDEATTTKRLQFDFTRDAEPLMVKVDAEQLRRALSYLIWYLTQHSPGEEAKVAISLGRHSDRQAGETVRILIGSRTAAVPSEKLTRVFDPVQMVQEGLIDVGPAVSQRLIEAQGGSLQMRHGRHELAFHVTLPAATT
jgi:PAS domain S-box-containing protein